MTLLSNAKQTTARRFPQWTRVISEVGVFGISVVVALMVYSVFIIMVGGNVFEAYGTILKVSLGSQMGWAQTLNKWTPLLLGSIAVALGNRSGVVNIGVDGQIFIGGTVATGVGFLLAGLNAPDFVLFPFVLISGLFGGAVWGGICRLPKSQEGN